MHKEIEATIYKSTEIIKITNIYIKKTFNIKNLLMFLITLFCFFTVFHSFRLIFNYTMADDASFYIIDYVGIMVYSIWIITMINYCYIYLKKNNFYFLKNYQNTISNLIIVITFAIILYSALFLIIFNKPDYEHHPGNNISIHNIFWIFVMLGLLELSFLGLFDSVKKGDAFTYVFIIGLVIMNLSFLLFLLTTSSNGNAIGTTYGDLIIKIFGISFGILVFFNISKRGYLFYLGK